MRIKELLNGSSKGKIALAYPDAASVEALITANADAILVGDEKEIKKINNIPERFIILNEPERACEEAVRLVLKKEASALMKGKVDTSIILRAALDKERGIRGNDLLSHIAAFETKSHRRIMFLTDAAINIAPNPETMQKIIINARDFAYSILAREPVIALLAAKEKPDPRQPVTETASELCAWGKNKGFNIYGPLALDNAIDPKSCKIKGIDFSGESDVLVCPNIEAGNILYKSLAFFAGARMGGLVLGARAPIILTSRADSADSKLISILLALKTN